MDNQYRLDKTKFSILSFEEADREFNDQRQLTWQERFRIHNHLNATAMAMPGKGILQWKNNFLVRKNIRWAIYLIRRGITFQKGDTSCAYCYYYLGIKHLLRVHPQINPHQLPASEFNNRMETIV